MEEYSDIIVGFVSFGMCGFPPFVSRRVFEGWLHCFVFKKILFNFAVAVSILFCSFLSYSCFICSDFHFIVILKGYKVYKIIFVSIEFEGF